MCRSGLIMPVPRAWACRVCAPWNVFRRPARTRAFCEDVSTMSQPSLPPRALPPRLRIALDAIRHGRAVILLDDDDRENEGDLIVAADRITVPMMATLIRECSG